MESLPRIRPCDAGIREAGVRSFVDAVEREGLGLHSLLVARHGAIAAETYWEPFRPEYAHVLHSLSKSFTSVAIGFAVQEGLLSIEDRVVPFFPEKLPADPCANMREMRVRHLLTMATGHSKEPEIMPDTRSGDWVEAFLRSYVDLAPGSRFVYNTPATYMLSAILQKASGRTTLDYLSPRLFEPLGFRDVAWETCPMGVSAGGHGLMLRTRDIAKFGQFLLQRGTWEGRRLLDPAWIDAATARQIENHGDTPDSRQGYGYQFWRSVPPGSYNGGGAFGQLCVVLPEQDAVVVFTAATDDIQRVQTLLWENLLPAMGEPFPEDAAEARALAARLTGLRVPTPAGGGISPTASTVSGRRYRFGTNPLGIREISPAFGEEDAFTFRTPTGDFTLPVGHGAWRDGFIPVPEADDRFDCRFHPHVACAGAWTADDTYELALRYTRAPTLDRMRFRFGAHGVMLAVDRSYAFQDLHREWTGILQED